MAMDPNLRKALDGGSFGFSSLAPGAQFKSSIFVVDDQVEFFKELIGQVKKFRVGHGRSVGYGLVTVIFVTEETPKKSGADQSPANRQYLSGLGLHLPM
jgi:hypothetical protein